MIDFLAGPVFTNNDLPWILWTFFLLFTLNFGPWILIVVGVILLVRFYLMKHKTKRALNVALLMLASGFLLLFIAMVLRTWGGL